MHHFDRYCVNEFILKILIICLGATATACGIAIFYAMNIGSDPISVFVDGQHRLLGLSYGTINWIDSAIYLIIILIFSRNLISYATLILGFGTGPLINLFVGIFSRFISDEGSFTLQILATEGFAFIPPEGDYIIRLLMQIPAVILLGGGLGLYLSANLGAAPLDGLVLLIKDKSKKPLRKVKIIFDFTAATLGFLFGGVVGVGTIIAILATGPIIIITIKAMEKLQSKVECKIKKMVNDGQIKVEAKPSNP